MRSVARRAASLPHVSDMPHGPAIFRNQTPEEKAKALEQRDGGHSLDRHGPNVSDDQLKNRLTKGVAADGAFSPVGNAKSGTGVSSKFISHEAYLETRAAAETALDAAITKTKVKMQALLDLAKAAEDKFKAEPPGPNKGTLSKAMADEQKKVSDGAAQIAAGEIPVKAVPKDPDPTKKVLMRASYEVVLDHGHAVGSGFEGAGGMIDVKDSTGTKEGKGFNSTAALPPMTRTRTTFDTGGGALMAAPAASTMAAAQHFPCVEQPGIT